MKPTKKLFTKIILATLLFVASVDVKADTVDPVSAKLNSVIFVKSEGNALVFKTDLQKLPAEGCTLYIKDEAGNILFSENIKEVSQQKLYRISRENLNGIFFEVRGRKFSFQESFNFQSRLEEVFTVVKMK